MHLGHEFGLLRKPPLHPHDLPARLSTGAPGIPSSAVATALARTRQLGLAVRLRRKELGLTQQ